MKKIFALILAIALLMTSVAAFAESVEAEKPKGTPNINSFATMKVKYVGGKFNSTTKHLGANNYWEITLSKPVDRLLVKWAEKGAEPEELAVDENLQATAIAWNHRFMPGTTDYYATWGGEEYVSEYEGFLGYDLETSERLYKSHDATLEGWNNDVCDNDPPQLYTWIKSPYRVIYAQDCLDENGKWDEAAYEAIVKNYILQYSDEDLSNVKKDSLELVRPTIDEDGIVWNGHIRFVYKCHVNNVNHHFQTRNATPDQTAFMTVQNGWAVYYNRSGKIVGIELFEGQF